MEENKKPTIITILLILFGLCLVGFGVWSAIKYFKGEETPSELGEETSSELEEINYVGGADFTTTFNSKSTAIEIPVLPAGQDLHKNFESVKKI